MGFPVEKREFYNPHHPEPRARPRMSTPPAFDAPVRANFDMERGQIADWVSKEV